MTPQSDADPCPSTPTKTVRVLIKGRVQGVFYRNWTIENATLLGLKGWVRNKRDGSVEALFSGDPDKVQEMEQQCRRGPPDALVTGLEVSPCNENPGTGFERRPTEKRGSKIVKKFHSSKMKNEEQSITILGMFTLFIRKLQLGLVHLVSREDEFGALELDEEMDARIFVPEDVKGGHFAVVAVKGGEPRRFVVELGNLSNPEFLRLLEQARDEYGFRQTGILAVPCRPEELQQILREKKRLSTEW